MTLAETTQKLYSPRGLTSIMEMLLAGKTQAAVPHKEGHLMDRETVATKVIYYRGALDTCKDDAEYWAYLAEVTYWETLERLHLAAGLVGAEHLPDVPLPDLEAGAIMDIIGSLEKFGKQVLRKAADNQIKP